MYQEDLMLTLGVRSVFELLLTYHNLGKTLCSDDGRVLIDRLCVDFNRDHLDDEAAPEWCLCEWTVQHHKDTRQVPCGRFAHHDVCCT